jgi:hypothetical protein
MRRSSSNRRPLASATRSTSLDHPPSSLPLVHCVHAHRRPCRTDALRGASYSCCVLLPPYDSRRSIKNKAAAAIQVRPPLAPARARRLTTRRPDHCRAALARGTRARARPRCALTRARRAQAQERQDGQFRAPKQRVEDFEELNEYRGRKRKEFEERIRRTRGSMCVAVPRAQAVR